MKKIFAFSLFAAAAANAYAAPDVTHGAMYAGAISAHNIGALHHSISAAGLRAFDASATRITSMPRRAPVQKADPAMYGRAPMYGTMPLYGEYGDDGTVTQSGRSGGDTPPRMRAWGAAAHFSDRENFKHFDNTDIKNTFVMAGIGDAGTQIGNARASLGAFGGYTDVRADNHYTNMDGNGGFLGVIATYERGPLGLGATGIVGKIFNDQVGDGFDNTWGGVSGIATYDLAIDPTLTLRPSLGAMYTYVHTDNFGISGATARTQNAHILELTPGVQAIKEIAPGWRGTIGARYVARHTTGTSVTTAKMHLGTLSTRSYAEYGIGLEKSFENLRAGAQILRHDGGREGWGLNLDIKFAF